MTPEFIRDRIVVNDSGCWIWQLFIHPRGYGMAYPSGSAQKSWRAHRLSWTVFNGPIPQGLMVCHRCDVRPCVNPEHLFLGTALDNAADAKAKGRDAIGERHPRAKLTPDQVQQIRRSKATHKSLAEKFGVSDTTIYAIKAGVVWKSVPLLAPSISEAKSA